MRLRTAIVLGLFAALGLLLSAPLALAEDWGDVKGQITFDAKIKIPEVKEIKVDKDQDHCLSKGKLMSEDWVIDSKSKGVKWAFVWLVDPDGKTSPPINPALAKVPDPVTIDQPCCMFLPRAVALRQGQTLTVKNTAPISHNVNWTGGLKNPGSNIILPPGRSLDIKDLKAANLPVSVSCNIHGWMKGWVRVFDHPYYAVTDKEGKFEIKGAPAGNYNLVVWHESSGWGPGGKMGTAITIKANVDNDPGKVEIKPAD